MTNAHDFTNGVAPNEGGLDRMRSAFERQKIDPDKLLDTLREERERQVDFITDTRALKMYPVGADSDLEAVLPLVPQSERLEPVKPRVIIAPADNREDEEWYRTTGPLSANAHAHQQIGAHLQIPRTYYKRMLEEAPDLLAVNVNNWFEANGSPRMFRTMRTNGNGGNGTEMSFVRGFMSDSYRRLDALDVGERLIPVLADPANGWDVRQCGITDLRVHIEAVYPNLTEEITVGDAVALGVKITTSDVGSGALQVALGIHRLICSNLAIVPDYTQRQIHVGAKSEGIVELLTDRTIRKEDELIMDKMRDVVVNMANAENFTKLVGTMRESAKAELGDPIAATEMLAKGSAFADFETNAIKNELVRSGLPTVWGLANAVTATARNLDFERKAQLEAVAGTLLTDVRGWKPLVEAAA